MTPEQKDIIRRTWQRIVPIADHAVSVFYDRLFEIDPDLRPLFAGADMTRQRKKLVAALALVVRALDRFEEFMPNLETLGRGHAHFGVRDEHYDTVGDALLWTLEKGLGEAWTAEARSAWTAAYTLVADTMRDGAASADAARPSEAALSVPA
jgi:hemoglobin-like flavoprotein